MAKNAFKQLNVFEEFLSTNIILPLTRKSVKISSSIYSKLRQAGIPVDDIDLLIAGVAIENEMTLVTNNDKHFSRITGIEIENWKKHEL